MDSAVARAIDAREADDATTVELWLDIAKAVRFLTAVDPSPGQEMR
jgi:hypothetical protein